MWSGNIQSRVPLGVLSWKLTFPALSSFFPMTAVACDEPGTSRKADWGVLVVEYRAEAEDEDVAVCNPSEYCCWVFAVIACNLEGTRRILFQFLEKAVLLVVTARTILALTQTGGCMKASSGRRRGKATAGLVSGVI